MVAELLERLIDLECGEGEDAISHIRCMFLYLPQGAVWLCSNGLKSLLGSPQLAALAVAAESSHDK